MTDSKKFNKISVTSAPSEDVVIYAGVSSEPKCDLDGSNLNDEGQSDFAFAEEDNVEVQEDVQVAYEPSPTIENDVEHQTAAVKSKAVYHETTLEDIESSKMSTMQKVIVAIAFVAVIGFVVWFIS